MIEWFRRYPWRTRAGLLMLVQAAAAFLIHLGVDPASFEGFALGVLDAAVLVGIVKNGEGKTTPVADPRADDGVPLIPATSLRKSEPEAI